MKAITASITSTRITEVEVDRSLITTVSMSKHPAIVGNEKMKLGAGLGPQITTKLCSTEIRVISSQSLAYRTRPMEL